LPLLLRALEYFEKSSNSDSLRVLGLTKDISVSTNNSKIEKLCYAKIVYTKCFILERESYEPLGV